MVGIILPPVVEIGLTDLPKSGGAMASPGTPRDNIPVMYTRNRVSEGVH